MCLLVSRTLVVWRAAIRVGCTDFNPVIFHLIAVRMMDVTIVQVISMTVVFDCGVATVRAVFVIVSTIALLGFLRHGVARF